MTSRGQASYRCFCTSKGCNDIIDTRTGQRGVLLNRRMFQDHQRAENHAQMRYRLNLEQRTALEQRASEAQARALENQENILMRAMVSLNLTVEREEVESGRQFASPPSRPDEVKYRNDIKRARIQQISDVQDAIDRLSTQLGELTPSLHSTTTSDQLIEERRGQCQTLAIRAVDLGRDLRMENRGPGRREKAVQELRMATWNNLTQLRQKIGEVHSAWENLSRLREEEQQADGRPVFDSGRHFDLILDGAPAVIQLLTLMVVACHVVLGLPRRGCSWLFSMCSYIVETTVKKLLGGTVSNYFAGVLGQWPKDIRTARDQFQLEANATIYAVCPKCHSTHKPSYKSDHPGVPFYPEKCRARLYGKRCGEIILRQKTKGNTRILVPIKPYVSFDFNDWFANMLSRENYEQMMDMAWDNMNPQSDGIMTDVFQGSVIREFKGFDQETHFSKVGGEDAGHYLFSLACDFFNPLRNLANGKKVSIGVIALICLNLPIHLRYQPENIFLAGIIPGPQEPKLDAINHYLKPVVDAFLELWTGVRFSQTCLYRLARLVFCAIVAVICDLPAARKVGGFASFHHAYYCSVCWCNKTQKTYDNYDYVNWRKRTGADCRHWAKKYSEASTAKHATSFLDRSGLRSTELLRLPYYDPTKFLVIDPMHNLYLGLIKEHFQSILGHKPGQKADESDLLDHPVGLLINIPEDSRNPLPETKHGKSGVRKLLQLLAEPITFDESDSKTFDEVVDMWSGNRISLAALEYVARGVGCISIDSQEVGGQGGQRDAIGAQTRNDNGEGASESSEDEEEGTDQEEGASNNERAGQRALPDSVQNASRNRSGQDRDRRAGSVPSGHLSGNEAKERKSGLSKKGVARILLRWRLRQVEIPASSTVFMHGSIFTKAEMQEIRHDIDHMIKPSWVTSVPTTVSSTGPKLKSDEWRIFGALYLPITLVRLWSKSPDNEADEGRQKVLHLTMMLLSAIAIASSRITSRKHADDYQKYMVTYRKELSETFPLYKCHANHHIALHLNDLLLMYGPLHGWWAFPLERMIGALQRISTNYKPGEYEETIGRSWYRSSNFRAVFARTTCPQAIKHCASMFKALIRTDKRNSLAIDSNMPDFEASNESADQDVLDDLPDFRIRNEQQLDSTIATVLGGYYSRNVRTARSLGRVAPDDGVFYTTHAIHEGNSCVLIGNVPFRIEQILQCEGLELNSIDTWLVVRAHKAFQQDDPYRAFPALRASIWSLDFEEDITLVHISQVDTHYAKCPITWGGREVVVVVSLSRVHFT